MMPDGVARILLAVSDSIELSIIAKATVVLGLALVAVRSFRHARASVRHVVLASAFGVLVVLPAVVRLLPPVAVSVPVTAPNDRDRPAAVGGRWCDDHAPSTCARRQAGSCARVARSGRHWLRSAWFAVAALFLVPVAIVLWRLHLLRRGGLPWIEGEPLVRTLAAQAGVRRSIDILRHERIAAPVTCGGGAPRSSCRSTPTGGATPTSGARSCTSSSMFVVAIGRCSSPLASSARCTGSIRWCGSRGATCASSRSAHATMRSCGMLSGRNTQISW